MYFTRCARTRYRRFARRWTPAAALSRERRFGARHCCERQVCDHVTEQRPLTAVGRRQLLGISISAAGVVAVSACGSPQHKTGQSGAPAEEEVPVTPPEDLMREHGVLKRVLLIYREGIRRLQASEQLPADALNAGAAIIRSFVEDYHEQLEEQHVFPKLEQAGKLTDVTSVLRTQHARGRVLTDRVVAATGAGTAL